MITKIFEFHFSTRHLRRWFAQTQHHRRQPSRSERRKQSVDGWDSLWAAVAAVWTWIRHNTTMKSENYPIEKILSIAAQWENAVSTPQMMEMMGKFPTGQSSKRFGATPSTRVVVSSLKWGDESKWDSVDVSNDLKNVTEFILYFYLSFVCQNH